MKIGNVDVTCRITTMVALDYASSQGIAALQVFEWLPKMMTPQQYIGLYVAGSKGVITEQEVRNAIDADPSVYGQIVGHVVSEVIESNDTASEKAASPKGQAVEADHQ